MHTHFVRLFSLMIALYVNAAQATVIQVLHTNDLHAALSTAGHPNPDAQELGDWSRIKFELDRLTQEAKAQGIETIRLDAGDFYEGTLDYFPNYGIPVLKAFQSMGFDAAALGNHDWLMGAQDTNRAFGMSPFSMPLLSANVKISANMEHLKKQILPSTTIERAGVKIGVFGLSTHESLYRWITRVNSRKRDLKILKYKDTQDDIYGTIPGIATKTVDSLRSDHDLVIALTHIGHGPDKALAESTSGLDLIVGGHSHSFIESLAVVTDPSGKEVPIVQSGFNGQFIGKVLIEVLPEGGSQVLSYELVKVQKEGPQDPVVAKYISESKTQIDSLYAEQNIDEVVGHSEVRLVASDRGPTAYGKFVVEAMRESAQADIALDIGSFHGNTPRAGGDVSRRKIMEMYPRKFEVDQNEGLYVYTARVPGWVLSLGIKYAIKWGYYLSFSGLEFDLVQLGKSQYDEAVANLPIKDQDYLTEFRAKNIRVDGKKICLFCGYTVAMPESLLRGAYGISPLLKIIFRKGTRTENTIWDASEQYLKKIGTIRKLNPFDHFTAREFSPRYQRSKAEPQHLEQYSPDEGIDAPWFQEHEDHELHIDRFLNELKSGINHPELLEKEEDEE